jgi:prepilin-type N-terminal cleavage/methylation domain-containing protein
MHAEGQHGRAGDIAFESRSRVCNVSTRTRRWAIAVSQKTHVPRLRGRPRSTRTVSGLDSDMINRLIAAFTLLEVMIVVAILGILAALATPNLINVIHSAELGATTDNVMGFLTEARTLAFADRRCVQVVASDKVAGVQQQLLARVLNTHDCDGDAGGFQTQPLTSAPRLQGAALWQVNDRLILDNPRVRVLFGTSNADGVVNAGSHPPFLKSATGGCSDLPASITVADCRELRYRPSGRVWQDVYDPTTPNAANVTVELFHTISKQKKTFVIGSNGFIITPPTGM